MCGITGILGNGDKSIVSSMASCLSHRGPDGFGNFESDLGRGSICLGQSRLAILDLNGSWQPIKSEHGCVLIQNGEIYNHQKIRESIPNYPWQTSGDGESILSLHRLHAVSYTHLRAHET